MFMGGSPVSVHCRQIRNVFGRLRLGNNHLILFSLVVGLLAVSVPLFGHHGHVEYENKAVTLKGTVTRFEWTNPHCILAVAVKNDRENAEDWYAEILPPSQMSRAGWSKESIKPGDEVTLVGRPGKKGAHIMWLEYLITPDGRKLDRDTGAR
jgi:hypothetical protein